ncbi:MAG: riboflavin synthase [Gammaproteobacteria bacterium]|nr:riboflavin synthase [Gammaproteobacteria bacterium]
MFTGIIQAVGHIVRMQPQGGDMRLYVAAGKLPMGDVALGDSICTNGVCLTVVDLPGDGYWADVSGESLRLTTLGELQEGSPVNLEKALTPQSRLGGHIVSGHVDGMGEIVSLREDARSIQVVVRAPDALAKYIAHKGSICIDGTSLTVNSVNGAEFDLNIIPQTMSETIFGTYQPGSKVNLEVDVIARYLERLIQGDAAARAGELTMDTLADNGFLR